MLDTIKRFLAIEPLHQRDIAIATPFDEFPPLATQIANIRTHTVTHPRVSIAEAIGVPAIQRAVTLISHTVGSLTMEGWRNGAPMDETPIVLARPDPYQTAVDWYSDVGWGMAVYGEAIGYVARRDGAGFPIALIDVPPVELTVEPNPRNRLRAIYKWGTITGTRYSTADPTGDFVHITYHRDSTSLRGVGPLQMCGVAVSVAVEAQNWAAGFFAGGGVPPLIIKSAVELDGST
ncbi:MAG: phage portal protein, partial [Candidatus Limnocylindrales bacterium]